MALWTVVYAAGCAWNALAMPGHRRSHRHWQETERKRQCCPDASCSGAVDYRRAVLTTLYDAVKFCGLSQVARVALDLL
jgi:hypothetical protein